MGPHSMAKRNAEIVLKYSTAYPFRLREQAMLCVYCSERYKDPSHFRRHVDVSHKHFSIPLAFAHIRSRKDFLKVDCTNLKCRLCSQPFPNVEDVAKHLVKHHGRKVNLKHEIAMQSYRLEKGKWFCLVCDERLSTLTSLCRHMTTSHYQKYTCDLCGRTYMTIEALRYHKKCSHTGQFVCRKCWTDFPTMQERKEHVKTSVKCWKYSCEYCGDRFQSWEAKNKHLVEKHDCPEIKYDCSECDETFNCRKNLNKHCENMHSGNGFLCFCGLKCDSQEQLTNHKVDCDEMDKAHKCKVCSKAFAKKLYLTQHMWIHSDNKRFECKLCSKPFIQKVRYNSHMKIHHPNISDAKELSTK